MNARIPGTPASFGRISWMTSSALKARSARGLRRGKMRPAFPAQFAGARLTSSQGLDRHIDGISGATLSVRALSRLARLALLLHRHIVDEASKP